MEREDFIKSLFESWIEITNPKEENPSAREGYNESPGYNEVMTNLKSNDIVAIFFHSSQLEWTYCDLSKKRKASGECEKDEFWNAKKFFENAPDIAKLLIYTHQQYRELLGNRELHVYIWTGDFMKKLKTQDLVKSEELLKKLANDAPDTNNLLQNKVSKKGNEAPTDSQMF